MKLTYNSNVDIFSFDSMEDLSTDLKRYLKPGNIALSGGSTYLKLLKLWGNDTLDLDGIDFLPVDERVVDFSDEMSNWGNTYRDFLSQYNKNRENHFIDAERYNEFLQDKTIDTVFLGVGDDGHTASLFSVDTVFSFSDRKAIATVSPKKPVNRVSLTGKYITEAKKIIIIFFGNGKREIVDMVLKGLDLPITTLLKEVKSGEIYIHKPLLGGDNE